MLELTRALVLDDAFAPPGAGAVSQKDKNSWIDFVSEDKDAQEILLKKFSGLGLNDIDDLLEKVTSDPAHIAVLWDCLQAGTLVNAKLELLFEKFSLNRIGKMQKPFIVCEALKEFVAADKLKICWKMEDVVGTIDEVDIAFIDFFLDDNEQDSVALERIRNYKEHLKKAKLLFIMSSRASLETQQKVRNILGIRAAFFEVMTKTDINSEFVLAKIRDKRSTYVGNKSLESIVVNLAGAAEQAAQEFLDQCEDLEVHDLRLLNLARLSSEGEPISAYLTWLASESIAAKIRRICAEAGARPVLDEVPIGVSGQIKQSKVLFELFSDVVFGPSSALGEGLHFGEVLTPKLQHRRISKSLELKRKATQARTKMVDRQRLRLPQQDADAPEISALPLLYAPNRYLLVLTPACDLARCSPSKNVLCVVGTGQDFRTIKDQVSNKLYGKHKDGLRHLLNAKGPGAPMLITWQKDQTLMLPVRELLGGSFRRVAQMNELYAQEVKEEVLRELGRVGTQIDPPPPFALHARISWKIAPNGAPIAADTEKDSFYSAVLSYAEQAGGEKCPVAFLSDEFKKWALAKIKESLDGQEPHVKLKNCMESLERTSQFTLKSKLLANKDGLSVRVDDESNSAPSSFWIDVALTV